MAEATPYEEQRRRQVEENKRKLEELRLHHLSAAVREAAAKPSPTKQRKRKARATPGAGEDVPLRRSGRVASLPERPKYQDEFQDFGKKIRRSYGGKRRYLSNRVYATDEEREHAITAAQELEEELGSDHPIFVKPMLQSHVTGGFWLGLPTHFSRKYLPKRDERIVLVDEADDEFDTLYLANKRGLSGGWRGFSIAHKLVDGDCLVFQLIQRTKFKVYIIRASSYYETDS
ncbi:B3 domain-containing protein Os06g0194400 [Oryza brachyantha]|uniref:TF-B3 domain-containing protein n=1 Tax=Oryza brachyantha TaxID=4533 RepID=J3MC16_ORYBR|nr:B3 domain-containing protein Os06g0194400 [Oryza brachyantha]